MLITAIDVGGSWIRVALYSGDKAIRTLRVPSIKSDKVGLLKIIDKTIFTKGFKSDVYSFGFPGPVEEGVLKKAPPLNLEESISEKDLEGVLRERVYINNDVNNATLAELKYGVGNSINDFVLVTLSTGIGTGIVIDRRVLQGAVGEFGHDVLETEYSLANTCSCGNKGCWVAQSSGYGVEKTMERIGKKLKCEEVFKSDDEEVNMIINNFRDKYNAHGFGNINNAYGTGVIVVMGGLGLGQFDRIIPKVELIKKYTVNEVPAIIKTSLGDNIGLIGAYIYATKRK